MFSAIGISRWVQVPVFSNNQSNFPTIFKNFQVSRADISNYVRYYATDYDLHKQQQRIPISSVKFENATVITTLLIFVFVLDKNAQKVMASLSTKTKNASTVLSSHFWC